MSVSKNTLRVLCAALAIVFAGGVLAQSAKPVAATAARPQQAAAGQQPMGPEGLFQRWDTDKNGVLSQSEFKAGWTEVQTGMALRKLHENFVAMDVNKSGFLEAPEYANLELIKKAGKTAPLMSAFDADHNGKLEFKEYVSLVNTLLKTSH